MKLTSVIFYCSALLGACDGSQADEPAPDGGARGDAQQALSIPSTPFPYEGSLASAYTSSGVRAELGHNACATGTVAQGWEPGTALCWPATEAKGRGGICGVLAAGCSGYPAGTCAPLPACGTYAPGTLRVWSEDDARYQYLGDPTTSVSSGTGGYVCLPNTAAYVIPC